MSRRLTFVSRVFDSRRRLSFFARSREPVRPNYDLTERRSMGPSEPRILRVANRVGKYEWSDRRFDERPDHLSEYDAIVIDPTWSAMSGARNKNRERALRLVASSFGSTTSTCASVPISSRPSETGRYLRRPH